MDALLPRLTRQRLPLAARGALLAFCGALAVARDGPGQAPTALLLLLLVGAVGVLTVPETVPRWLQPVGESLAAAIVVGTLPGVGVLFVPYLLVPFVTAGLQAGALAAAACTGLVGAVFLAVLPLTVAGHAATSWPALMAWLPLLAAAGQAAAWVRRATRSEQTVVEPAYADAHRLLSELHVVARQLSLGLDPPTLAEALVQELHEIVPTARATVLVRSGGNRFVPLVGEATSSLAEAVVLDAWVSSQLVRRGRSGVTVVALPVLMGARVVAVVVLTDSSEAHTLGDVAVRSCRTAIDQAGPRLASALLFDDVRRLATDDERARMAREIHDGIAQDMASVGYLLDDIADDADPDVASRLKGLREHLGSVVSELRLSIFDLRTGVDESVGLARTIGDYAHRVGTQAGLIVHVSVDEAPTRLPVATEVEILRIVQEAVTNVRRHAEANNVWLSVVIDPPRAHITVADDGRGLGTPRPDSIGITGMKERAARIGATLDVRNRPEGRGTIVELLLERSTTSTRRNWTITDARHASVVPDSPRRAALPGRQAGGGPS